MMQVQWRQRPELARLALFGLALAASLGSPAPACLALPFHVSLDTSLLIDHPSRPFYVEFQLNDGSGTDDGNNTARIDNFQFGGGAAEPAMDMSGGASGDLLTGVEITDSAFFNQFLQQFRAGTELSFDVRLSTLVDLGPQPDQFSFAILDCARVEIPTTSPANALLSIDINDRPAIQTFSGTPDGVLACTGAPSILLPAPRVTLIDEPGTPSLLVLATVLAVLARIQRLGEGA